MTRTQNHNKLSPERAGDAMTTTARTRCTGIVTSGPRNSWRCTHFALKGTDRCRMCTPRPLLDFVVVFHVHLASGEWSEIEVPMQAKSAGDAIGEAWAVVQLPADHLGVDRPTIKETR